MPRRSRDAGREVAPIKELDRREVAGAVADLGVLVPIVVALILVNGLSASAVLLPAAPAGAGSEKQKYSVRLLAKLRSSTTSSRPPCP